MWLASSWSVYKKGHLLPQDLLSVKGEKGGGEMWTGSNECRTKDGEQWHLHADQQIRLCSEGYVYTVLCSATMYSCSSGNHSHVENHVTYSL